MEELPMKLVVRSEHQVGDFYMFDPRDGTLRPRQTLLVLSIRPITVLRTFEDGRVEITDWISTRPGERSWQLVACGTP